MESEFRIGVITSTHGIAGEVKVFPTTDEPNRFKKLKKCQLRTEKENLDVEIASVKFFKNMVILKFKQFSNINEVEKYRNAELYVDRDNAIALDEGEYYIADLIGLKVIDENDNVIGELTDVLTTAANDVYEISTAEGHKYLFPAIKQCILSVNLEEGIMRVHVLKGLLDL